MRGAVDRIIKVGPVRGVWAEEKRQKDLKTEKWGGLIGNYFSVSIFSVSCRHLFAKVFGEFCP
jgi:hypothetical protein